MSCQRPNIPPRHPQTKKPDIDCLKVKKVFEECSSTFVAKVKIPVTPPHHGHEVKCVHAHISPKHLECMVVPDCSKVMLLENEVKIHVHANLINDHHTHPVMAQGKLVIPETEREFLLERAGEHGLDCEIDIFAECLECSITCKSHDDMVSEITCCVGVLIIVKLVDEVQLMVPNFGYCPVPPRCETKSTCPPSYNPTAIPFPPEPKKFCPPTTCPPTTCPPTTCPPRKCLSCDSINSEFDVNSLIDIIM